MPRLWSKITVLRFEIELRIVLRFEIEFDRNY